MPTLKVIYGERDGYATLSNRQVLKVFSPDMLGIGDLSEEGNHEDAFACVFDLQGFTDFCNQIDPHLVVPEFLAEFFDWLFHVLRKEFIQSEEGDEVTLWCQLPFFAKFLGDGVLFLWRTHQMNHIGMGSLVTSLYQVCKSYADFRFRMRRRMSKVPEQLRCGIARGQVVSLGGQNDYAGACINVASRLQKLGLLSFAFSRRGLDVERCFDVDSGWREHFLLVRARIRGIGDEEPVYIVKKQYDRLPLEEKEMFKAEWD